MQPAEQGSFSIGFSSRGQRRVKELYQSNANTRKSGNVNFALITALKAGKSDYPVQSK
jgi:hypothetical protein